MKTPWITLALAGLFAASANAAADAGMPFTSDKDKASYIIGLQTGRNFRKDQIEVELSAMLQGMKDGVAGSSQISEEDTRKFMSGFMNDLKRKSRVAAEDSRMKAAAFLVGNRGLPGVITLASGVQYRMLKRGEGPLPVGVNDVLCEFRGTLLDGTEFDRTEPGKPATLKLAGLIPGWREALELMPVGSRWQLFIPPEQGYGIRGAGLVGPNELLTVEVELLAIR
jgi:FKBP-type peptidyl-prolyl cis-trans isomerase